MTIRADGRTSWYGGPRDSGDNNIPALPGASNKNPGIAVLNRHTLGGYWWVKYPNGHSLIVQQTDYGPSVPGRTVDTNYTAVRAAGYTEGNYPTGGHVQAVFLGHGAGHAHRQAARLGLGGGQAAAPSAPRPAGLHLVGLFGPPSTGLATQLGRGYVPGPETNPAYWGR